MPETGRTMAGRGGGAPSAEAGCATAQANRMAAAGSNALERRITSLPPSGQTGQNRLAARAKCLGDLGGCRVGGTALVGRLRVVLKAELDRLGRGVAGGRR